MSTAATGERKTDSPWALDRWHRVLEERARSRYSLIRVSPRWYPLVPHPVQEAFGSLDGPRFRVCAAGRRSGKTERAKRALALYAMTRRDAVVIVAAPTRLQAKRIYWDDLRALIPPDYRDVTKGNAGVSHTELTIWCASGSRVIVAGLDRHETIEGIGADFVVLDEFASMKPTAWTETIRPMLSDPGREGRCWFVGRPAGRNHFWELFERAKTGSDPDWAAYHWTSEEILPSDEIEAARRDLDERSYRQEYRAEFLSQEGLVYYPFQREVHVRQCEYAPDQPLDVCFDFNVSPGVAAVCQDRGDATVVLGEVWIAHESHTLAVCEAIVRDWGPVGRRAQHTGRVRIYGDATGGARGTAKVAGTDWDLVRERLSSVWPDLEDRVPRRNPPERVRVNALNARLRSASGDVRLYVDPSCRHLIRDFEGVTWAPSGSIEKVPGGEMTHLTDAIGYYIHAEHPIVGATVGRVAL